MNDKQQLAAMGDELRLTEKQAKALVERLPKMERSGVLQLTDSQPMCMAKLIEELEERVRVMSELLTRCRPYIVDQAGWGRSYEKVVLLGIDEALSGKLNAAAPSPDTTK